MALARIRQLAAHEVGHTLGFAHNFAASSYGRASVMDYPAPWVEIKDGKLDLSNAYATGIGDLRQVRGEVRRTRSSPPAPTRRADSKRSSKPASPAACSTSPTPTRGRPTPRIRSPASGTAAATRSPRCARDGGAADRAVDVRHSQHPGRHAAVRARAPAPAALPASPLSAAGGGEIAWRRVLHLRRTDCRRTQSGRRWRKSFRQSASVRRSMPCSRRCRSMQLRIPERILDLIPPAGIRIRRRHRRSVRPPDRSDLRSDRRRRHRRRPRDQRAPAARSAPPAWCSNRRVTRAVLVSPRLSRVSWTRRGGRRCRSTVTAARSRAKSRASTVARLMDLAANASASLEVRSAASAGLRQVLALTRSASSAHATGTREDIERFLRRPDAPQKRTPPLPAPAGEPIGGGIR